FDGRDWTPVELPPEREWHEKLVDVWGTGPSDVWVVSERASILHWDGVQWSAAVAPLAPDRQRLTSVWTSAPDDVWASGSGLLHFDGRGWTEVTDVPFDYSQMVRGSSPCQLWVYDQQDLYRFQGGTWTRAQLGVAEPIHDRGLFVPDADHLLVVG